MFRIEVEVAQGIEDIARQEILATFGAQLQVTNVERKKAAIQFDFSDRLASLQELKSIVAPYIVLKYAIPRPKALLGHQHFQQLMETIAIVRTEQGSHFNTFSISAAGSHSSVMQRIRQTIAESTGLMYQDETGDLLLRIRRVPDGWEVLLRIGDRPASTRFWRVCNMPGALNAPVAYAICKLAGIDGNSRVANLMCGSGSLMIETALNFQPEAVLGYDYDLQALDCACQNLKAAGLSRLPLIAADVRALPLPAASVDVIIADLPFGQRIGAHAINESLYPDVMKEAARVSRENAVFAFITHELRLTDQMLVKQKSWQLIHSRQIALRGLHPRIYLLRKR
ncbi:MAG: methyltransferase domain-containing protein [Chloroflexota bacterium]